MPSPVSSRFRITTRTTVPKPNTPVDFYRQGATASAPTTIPGSSSDTPISVLSTGELALNDVVSVGPDGPQLTIDGIPGSTQVTVTNSSGSPVAIATGVRLIALGNRPAVYTDRDTQALATSSITSDANARVLCYVDAGRFDYVVAPSGSPKQVCPAAPGGDFRGDFRSEPWLNVLDFPTFQAAHDALPATGGTVFVPAGTYTSATTPAFTGLVVTKSFALIGETSSLSIIVHDMTNAENIDAIFLNVAGGCVLKNLLIAGKNLVGTGRGVRWYKAGTAGMAGLSIDNVTVWRSPNLSFEFVCDGGSNNWVSKLEMIQCTAYEALSGGSVFLGGAGSNNNWFERCEFNGPGFGGFHNVNSCSVTNASTTVSAPDLSSVQAGDEVSGMGIAAGTTVVSVNTVPNPDTMVLSKAAIETFPLTTLTFYRASPSPPTAGRIPRGHVHLMRTSISRFHHCSFQGPGTSPAISTDLVSNDLELRDSYREKSTAGSEVHSFMINGMSNLLIDGLIHQFHTENTLLLKTWPAGLVMGRVSNAQLVCNQNPLASTKVVELSNPTDELIIDNSMEQSSITGGGRDLVVFGVGAVLPTIASAGTIALPNGSDENFIVTGTTTITNITARRPKRRVTLVFTGTLTVSNSGNIRLLSSIAATPTSTLTLVCDGTNWFEVCSSAALRLLAKTADQLQTTTSAVDIADLTVPLAANEVIHFEAHLIASAVAATTGIQLAINGPAGAVQVDATIVGWTSATVSVLTGVNAFDSFQANTSSAGTTRRAFEIVGRVINGVNAGTFALRLKSEVVLSGVTVHRGSWLQYSKGAN